MIEKRRHHGLFLGEATRCRAQGLHNDHDQNGEQHAAPRPLAIMLSDQKDGDADKREDKCVKGPGQALVGLGQPLASLLRVNTLGRFRRGAHR